MKAAMQVPTPTNPMPMNAVAGMPMAMAGMPMRMAMMPMTCHMACSMTKDGMMCMMVPAEGTDFIS